MKIFQNLVFLIVFLLAQFSYASSTDSINRQAKAKADSKEGQTEIEKKSVFFDKTQIKPKQAEKYYSGEVGIFGVAGINTHRGDDFYPGDILAGGGFYSNLETANSYVPNWHLGFYAVNTTNPNQLEFMSLDNIIYWNVIPKRIDFVKLDLGTGIRLGNKIFIIATAIFYLDLDFTIPSSGWHFSFTSKNGLLPDFTNQDVKLAIAYDFDLQKVKLGIETAYNFWIQFPIFSPERGFLTHSGIVSLYVKW